MCTSDIRRLSIILARRPSLIDTAIRQQWYFCASHSDRSLKYYPRALWIPGDQLNVMLNALTRRIEMHMGISFYEKKKSRYRRLHYPQRKELSIVHKNL